VRYYDCEQGGPLQLTIREDTATVRFDGRRHVLPRVAASDGERWTADGILLWIKDGEPSVTIGDQVLVWGCRAR
jgi:membrane-bound inhibitor of C-type lysozyme